MEPDTSDGSSRNGLKDIGNATKDEVEIIREHPASLVFRLTTKNIPLDQQHLTTSEVVKSTSDTFRLTTKIVNLAHKDFLDHFHVETSNFYNSSVNQNKKINPIKMQTAQRLSTTAPFLTTKDQVAVSLSILNLKASRKPQRTKANHLRSHLKKSVKRDGQDNQREQTNQNELEKEDDNIDFEIVANEPDRMRHKIRKFFKANETIIR